MQKPERPIFKNIFLDYFHSSGKCHAFANEKNVYINFGIPGETVHLRSGNRRLGYRTANITELILASPARILPICPHVCDCGGCNWMHMEYSYQLKYKHELLVHALEKYGIESGTIPPVVPSPQTTAYRNKITYRLVRDTESGQWQFCFNPPDTHFQPVPVSHCYIQDGRSEIIKNTILSVLNEKEYSHNHHFIHSLTIRTSGISSPMLIFGIYQEQSDTFINFSRKIQALSTDHLCIHYFYFDPAVYYPNILSLQTESFYETIGTFKYRISPSAFLQPNIQQAANIFREIERMAALTGTEVIHDLYCGAGTISCYLAPHAGHVLGIEGNGDAVSDAAYNAQLNNLSNTTFIHSDILANYTPEFIRQHGQPDIIVLDPPRSGTLIEIQKTMVYAAPLKIIYLSCNPVSLAWNLQQLCIDYAVTEMLPFDMFPQTHHLETLVLLERRKKL